MRWIALIALLAACDQEVAEAPAPVALTDDALGYFCQMHIAGHDGPKGQIHLANFPQPLFFAQVRDVVAYLKGPEREADITAIYVSDMGSAQSWAQPGDMNWTDARSALYVVGADVRGGMGAPEIAPFATRESAQAFTRLYGGTVMTLDEIPDDAALGPVDLDRVLEDPA
ncbi:nitrous oxide reductase accessory protein NosL [Pikeienuella sp. HZG-20]|uniref:nitrous oxide reductase accessory protein NosL n=1 Tax=Paludibacillus litoralis TaxID=3133267 RepID=UPI0030EB540E